MSRQEQNSQLSQGWEGKSSPHPAQAMYAVGVLFYLLSSFKIKFALCWLTTPERGTCPEVWLVSPVIFFLFASGHQLQIASWLGVRLCVYFLSPSWDFLWLELARLSLVHAVTTNEFIGEAGLFCPENCPCSLVLPLAQVLVYSRSVWDGLQMNGPQIQSDILAIPTTSLPLSHQYIRKAGHHSRLGALNLGQCLLFSSIACSVPSSTVNSSEQG